MSVLYGTQSDGTLIPVQADSQGRLVAELANRDTAPSYQDGTWTPVFQSTYGGFTANYGIQLGLFYRIGQWVTAQFRLKVSSVLTANDGSLAVGNVPYLLDAQTADLFFPGNIARQLNFPVGKDPQTVLGREQFDGAELVFYRFNQTTNSAEVIESNQVGANSEVVGSVTYRTDDTTFIPINPAVLR